MSQRELSALKEKGITVGSTVRTAFRGGVRQGKVEEITEEPKVVFTRKRPGQKDKTVVHNPSTLEKVEPGMKNEDSEELAKAKSAVQRSGRGRSAKGKGGKKAGAGAGKKAGTGAGKKAANGEKAAGGPKKAPTKKEGAGGGKAAAGSAHAARHSSRIATRRHRQEAGTSEAVAGEEKVGYRKRSKREQ